MRPNSERQSLLLTIALACTLILVLFNRPVYAQSYPTKPIRLIVPSPPGGAVDILSRIVGEKLAPAVGQQIVVDNRAGANGTIGTEICAKAPPDGYTLVMGYVGPIAVNISLYRKLPYDPVKDLAPVTLVAQAPQVLVAHPSLPAQTVQQLIRLAKSKPGQLTFGSPGAGSGGHLTMELFKTITGLDLVHVPYKGAAPALTDLLGGQITLMLSSTIGSQRYVKDGKLKALAVTGRSRSSALPEVPTMIESGLDRFESTSWFGVLAPAGTPREIISRLSDEITKILRMQDVRSRLASLGAEPSGKAPDEFAAYIKTEIAKWGKVIKNAGIEPQ
ncbi:MAG: hypothetical protein A3F74_27740 [Betaproteobacteria bacterium RIFCSPLOWO2_12_FULL_62_58]|nr:MAG: hypothetical protein A3F74_27740 [Betaproteobacteria bacterium RIFCSPLOWO2_12_FULL_62_58]